MEAQMNLTQKLACIRKLVEVVQKDKSGFNYKYVSIAEILAKVTAGEKKYNVSLVPRFVPESASLELVTTKGTKFTKTGQAYENITNEYLARGIVVYTWIDDETGEKIEIPWFIAGSQADPAQALGSAMTYGLRQFLCQYFQISQPEDDPDNWRSKQKEAENAENAEIARAIVDEVHDRVTAILESKPDERQRILDIVKKHVKEKGRASANYYAIKDPSIARGLLDEILETYTANEGNDAK